MTGSPISDMNPVLMASDVDLHVQNFESSRTVKMNEYFFTGYRRNVIKPDELLTAITIPYTTRVRHIALRNIPEDVLIPLY